MSKKQIAIDNAYKLAEQYKTQFQVVNSEHGSYQIFSMKNSLADGYEKVYETPDFSEGEK